MLLTMILTTKSIRKQTVIIQFFTALMEELDAHSYFSAALSQVIFKKRVFLTPKKSFFDIKKEFFSNYFRKGRRKTPNGR